MRLAPETLAALPATVERPRYDAAQQRIGQVHLGIGAFHRAHQAVYTDDAMNAGDRDWRIAGVSLRQPIVHDQLAPQAGLYTVTERSGAGERSRLIAAIAQILVAPRDPARVSSLLAAPTTQLVTLTVTEKAYQLPSPGSDGTIYDYLASGLATRRAHGHAGLTLLSCDNLAGNGEVLAGTLDDFLRRSDPALADWVAARCTFPSSMVDRIVPATELPDRETLVSRLGIEDEAAVFTEPYRQWVIEDRFAGRRPDWESGGAELVADVRPYEMAKLRMLNGAHSALAYLGLERGLGSVHEAVRDPVIAPIIDALMRLEAAPSINVMTGQDLNRYADALIDRFANPALNHRLAQIAMDGSQKIPQRWLHTLAWHQARGHACPAILRALGAWLRHLRGTGHPVSDPRSAELAALWTAGGVAAIVDGLFSERGLFASDWTASPANRQLLLRETDRAVLARQP